MSFIAQITADISNFDKNIKKATDIADSSTKKMQASFDRLGDSFIKIGKRASILSAGVTALGFAAGRAAINFESAFAGVRKTVEATEDQFASLSTGIRAMSKELPASAVEIAGVAEAAGQLGIQTESILTFTRTMIDLGEASNMASREAATQLARFANITQMSQKDFDRLGATIVDLGNNLATTEGEMVEMSLRLAAAGKQVGMTEAEIVSFAGALSSVGIEAQAGGTAFSRVMTQMQLAVETGSSSLRDFASVAGMTVEEFSTAFRTDASGAIISFIEGLSRANEEGTSTIKVLDDMGISEIRLRDALMRASGAGDLFRESIERGSRAWEKNTALTEEAAQRYATTESKLKILKNTLTEVAIEFGEILLPHIQRVAESLKDVLEIVNSLDPSIKKIIITVSALTIALGPLLLALGKLLQILPAIKLAFTALTGPIGIAVTAIVAGATLIIANWDKIKIASNNVVKYIKDDWERLKESFEVTNSSIGKLMKADFNGWWDDVKKSFDLGIDYLKNRWKQLKNIFKDSDEGIGDAAAGMMAGAIGPTIDAVDELTTSVDETTDSVDGLGDSLDKLGGKSLIPAGSLKELSEKLKVLYEQLDNATTTSARVSVATLIKEIEAKRATLELELKVGMTSPIQSDIAKVATGSTVVASDVWSVDNKELSERMSVTAQTVHDNIAEMSEDAYDSMVDFSGLIARTMTDFAGIIGNAFGGDFSDFGANLLGAVGNFAQQFGGLVIAAAITAESLKKLITNPFLAAAAGAALVTLGAVVSKKAQSMTSNLTGGGYSSAPSMQTSQPTLGNSDYRGAYQDDFKVEFSIGNDALVATLDTAQQRRKRI